MTMIIDGTNGLTFNNATTQNSGGKVLQVVSATTSTETSTSTSTYVDTNLTATITPLFSTSKILVLVNQQGCQKRTGDVSNGLTLRLMRSSTELIVLQLYGGYTDTNSFNYFSAIGGNYLDSPATTSAVTYKTQFKNEVNGASVIVQGLSSTSTITLMEIAG
jgi:hypothetical protein